MFISKQWIATILTAVLAAGALAAITTAQSGGTIYGCYKTQNGQLRVIDAGGQCLPSETLIQWNQTGPQGPQGAQGERGPSDAYDVYRNPSAPHVPINGTSFATGTKVLETELPPGKFAITAKVNVSAGTTGGGLVRCYTKTVSGWFDMGISSIGPNAGETREATLSTTFGADEAGPGPLNITCWRQNGVGPSPLVGLAEAVAIQVANIHISATTVP